MWSTSQGVDAISFGKPSEVSSTGSFDSYRSVWNSNNCLANTGYQQWPQQSQQMLQQNHQLPQYQQCPNLNNYRQSFITGDLPQPNHSSRPSRSEQPNQCQVSQVQQQLKPVNASLASNNTRIPKSHQARITLVHNTNGGFRAIVKRKRKRTQFTTEQIETLESFFRNKPYITREERQILVQQLQVGDSAVKVWFQNRRLRGKKEDQAYYSDSPINEELNTTNSRLDYIEAELNKKADRSGYITLDETAINEIVSVVDEALSDDIELDQLRNNIEPTTEKSSETGTGCVANDSGKESLFEESSKDTESSGNAEEIAVSEGSACLNSFYEPISPATSVPEYEQPLVWSPLVPKQSLQRLFDLHFC